MTRSDAVLSKQGEIVLLCKLRELEDIHNAQFERGTVFTQLTNSALILAIVWGERIS